MILRVLGEERRSLLLWGWGPLLLTLERLGKLWASRRISISCNSFTQAPNQVVLRSRIQFLLSCFSELSEGDDSISVGVCSVYQLRDDFFTHRSRKTTKQHPELSACQGSVSIDVHGSESGMQFFDLIIRQGCSELPFGREVTIL